MQWIVHFIVHSHIIEQKDNWTRPIVHNDIYSNFVKSFKAFEKVCEWPLLDGAWIYPIVDLYGELLIKYA